MNGPCPGACNAATRRLQRDHAALTIWHAGDPATRGPAPAAPLLRWTDGEPNWCPRDATAIAGRLAELVDLVPLLEATIDGHRGPAGDDAKVTVSQGHPSPAPAVDDIDEVLRTIEAYEVTYRALRGFPPPPARSADLRLCLSAAFLQRYLRGALGSAVGHQLGYDITRLHRMVRARTHSDEAKRRMPAPCPRCDMKCLTYRAGDTYVACEGCGRLMLLGEYDAHVTELTRRTA